MSLTGYLAAEGFEEDLLAELGGGERHGRLILAEGPARPAAWAQNVWHDVQILDVASIGDAAKQLRAIQRNWWPYAFHMHRRTALLVEKLPKVSAKPVSFGAALPDAPLGSFAWLDDKRLLAAAHCRSAFPNGEIHFVEDKEVPPNRAYLKLWEALTRCGELPQPGQRCIDLGSSPGGWTWVLAACGASEVVSVDKAPLDPKIAAMPNVTFRQESAFGLAPAEVGPVDWLCCDVICYPERLWRLVEAWRESGLAQRFVCTIKFQGPTDHEAARRFAAIEGSAVLHLFHNKHELTWIYPAPRKW